MRSLIFGVIIIVFNYCSSRKTEYNYDCGLTSSTPTDLKIINNTIDEVELKLSVFENQLNEFKRLNLNPDESVTICVEYEGPITDGIHIEFDGVTSIIKLKGQLKNEFKLVERSLN